MDETRPFHITIARQLASRGSDLGQRIAQKLGFAYLDRQILQNAAEELGMTEAELSHREERIRKSDLMPPRIWSFPWQTECWR